MKGVLPKWLEHLLGLEASEVGEGTAYSFEHSWPWASWITLLVAAFVVGLVVYVYSRERGTARRIVRALLASLRLSAFAVLAFIIAQVFLSLKRADLPTVVLMVDVSASMREIDVYDEEIHADLQSRVRKAGLDALSRLNLAKSTLLDDNAEIVRKLADRYRLETYFVAEDAQRVPVAAGDVPTLLEALREAKADGQKSELGNSLRRVIGDFEGAPPAAILFFTDGITTEGDKLGSAATDLARHHRVPLFLVALGSGGPKQDLHLDDARYKEWVFKGDLIDLRAQLTGTGFEGRKVTLVLKNRNDNQTVAQQTVTVGKEPQQVRMLFRPTTTGEQKLWLEVEPQPEEQQAQRTENNRVAVNFDVREEQINVLLVQAYPSYEFRYLKEMLRRQKPAINVQAVLQEADAELPLTDSTARRLFPLRAEELDQFHVILFGDVNPSFLTPQAMTDLRNFVDKGRGGVAFFAGPKYTPLAYRGTPLEDLFPVDLGTVRLPDPNQVITNSFAPRLTRLGSSSDFLQLDDSPAQSDAIWRDLPELFWLAEVGHVKAAAQVLVDHPDRSGPLGLPLPVVVTQRFGTGNVLFHATDETWRWRWRVGDRYFERYWMQVVRWLAWNKLRKPTGSVVLTPLRTRYEQGETVRLRARFYDGAPRAGDDNTVQVMLESPGQKDRSLSLAAESGTPGIYEASIRGLSPGTYSARTVPRDPGGTTATAEFTVDPPAAETQRLQTDLADMQAAAKASGGEVVRVADVADLVDRLPVEEEPEIKKRLPPILLWDRWPILALFLGLLGAEWLFRKRYGML